MLNSAATATDAPKGLLRRVWIWLTLLCCLRGDAKRLKASWISEMDIKKYLSKHSNNVNDYFFVSINTSKICILVNGI